jgi:hypothetical protein
MYVGWKFFSNLARMHGQVSQMSISRRACLVASFQVVCTLAAREAATKLEAAASGMPRQHLRIPSSYATELSLGHADIHTLNFYVLEVYIFPKDPKISLFNRSLY